VTEAFGARLADPLVTDAPGRTAGRWWGMSSWLGRFDRVTRRAGSAFRLATLYAIVLAAVLTGSITALLRTTTAGVQTIAIRQLTAELESYQQAVGALPARTSLKNVSTSYLRSHAVPDQNLVEVAVPDEWALANAGGSAIASDPSISTLAGRVPPRTAVLGLHAAGRDLEVLVSPIHTPSGPPGVLVAAVDLSSLRPARAAALRLAIGEGAIAFVAGVVSAYLLLRRLLRRIGHITDAAERIGRDRLAERLGEMGTGDEVDRLAVSFDSMLDRIESAVNAQHELLSDVSHQLRTPLTVARGHLEVLGRTRVADENLHETIGVAISELDRMSALVERLLELGRAREPVRRDAHDVDLRSFFGDFITSCRVLAARSWVLQPVPDEVVHFDETEVRGALLNLVDNAVRATRRDDIIMITTRVTRAEFRISVEDSGPGILPTDREAALNRFARPSNRATDGPGGGATGRTGLGLAIASAVCHAHGGTAEISDSSLGGAMVTLILLRADDPEGAGCESF
jgi:signal transduction histidine kinase